MPPTNQNPDQQPVSEPTPPVAQPPVSSPTPPAPVEEPTTPLTARFEPQSTDKPSNGDGFGQSSYQAAPSAPQPSGEDPGHTMGIVGLVLSFLFPLAGVIVSAIALNKSKKAGFKNTIALVGVILGAVLTVFGLLSFILTLMAIMSADPATTRY